MDLEFLEVNPGARQGGQEPFEHHTHLKGQALSLSEISVGQ